MLAFSHLSHPRCLHAHRHALNKYWSVLLNKPDFYNWCFLYKNSSQIMVFFLFSVHAALFILSVPITRPKPAIINLWNFILLFQKAYTETNPSFSLLALQELNKLLSVPPPEPRYQLRRTSSASFWPCWYLSFVDLCGGSPLNFASIYLVTWVSVSSWGFPIHKKKPEKENDEEVQKNPKIHRWGIFLCKSTYAELREHNKHRRG